MKKSKFNMVGILFSILSFSLMSLSGAMAGEVQIVDAKAQKRGSTWHFDVTLKHEDSGWDHYADAWKVVTEDGKELGTRTLFHPHEDEQPFTRSLGNVQIPAETDHVYIEAHDKVHGWSKQRFKVMLK